MDVRAETRTRSARAVKPGGSPPSSAGTATPPADEDDGRSETDWPFPEADEEWPGYYGAARLGIP